ncbi:unnamed protein product [Rhodiola kirilowii]
MDVKAMTKSKRSHTQHHSKKSYPKPNARDNMDAAQADGKSNRTSGRKVVEKKPVQSGAAELPSNSDRYLDENDSGSEDLLHGVASSNSNQGFGDMLSVRGEAILSWTAADYFIVEEKEIPSYEASCLSLNLNTLNKQLAKVDLAQRLFVDEYYLIEGKIEAPWLTPDFGSENAILDLLVVIPSTTWDICYSATQVEATQVGINVTLPSTLPISLENMHMFVYVSSCHNCKPNLD